MTFLEQVRNKHKEKESLPKLPEEYNPPFFEVLKRRGFFYISKESFEQQDIICYAITKKSLERFLTDNNYFVSKFSLNQYKIVKEC